MVEPLRLAPVALFAYDRPAHLRRVLEALQHNELAAESDLVIFCDGAKDSESAAPVEEVRQVARTVSGFRSIRLVERTTNLGLSRSIISGVTELCELHGRVIVLEDDLVTSRYFLRFMNEALELYAGDPEVISVHGYTLPVDTALPETWFLRGADCWGWATWKRGWDELEQDGSKLLSELESRSLVRSFDLDGAMCFSRMLRDQIAGRIDSWAIRWHASAYLGNRMTLYPGFSLVQNIGHDATGTHSEATDQFDVALADRAIHLTRIAVEESSAGRSAVIRYYRAQRRPLVVRVLARACRLLSIRW